jgi:HlyD family secretion protein
VAYIAPAVDLARGTVEVKLDVDSPPPFLRPDMTVSVNVETGRDARAIVLPAAAIRDPGTTPWALVIRDGKTVRQAVTLGLRGDGTVQVLSGLAPGEAVISPAAPVGPGRRVRAEPAR